MNQHVQHKPVTAEIICVGTELVSGHVVDTNSAHLATELATIGIPVLRTSTVRDDLQQIENLVIERLKTARLLIISGGLGPTEDDITRQAVSSALGRSLELSSQIAAEIKRRFSHISIPDDVIKRQALVPQGAILLKNSVGTAPGIVLDNEKATLILLPGVPEELRAITPHMLTLLLQRFPSDSLVLSHTLKTTGLGESTVNERIMPLMQTKEPSVSLLAVPGEVHIRLTAHGSRKQAEAALSALRQKLRQRVGEFIFGEDSDTLEGIVAGLLLAQGLSLSLAESCTGGLISHRLTNVPGVSARYLLGVASYSNAAKTYMLGVPADLIEKHGAVSPEVATAMAQGVRARSNSDIALGVTGIAGPTGGGNGKPVGLVYIALSSAEETMCTRYQFTGERKLVKWRASQAALELLRNHLLHRSNKVR